MSTSKKYLKKKQFSTSIAELQYFIMHVLKNLCKMYYYLIDADWLENIECKHDDL